MAAKQINLKFSELSDLHQETVLKFYPVVKKIFLVGHEKNTTLWIRADQEFKPDIVDFLCTMETIFGEVLPKPITLIESSKEQFIVQSYIACSRLSYRNWFFGYSYLPVEMLKTFHAVAKHKAVLNIWENVTIFNLTGEEITALKGTILSKLDSEILWIDEVNNLMKSKVFHDIKGNIHENLKKLVNEEFPYLVRETETNFYEKGIFRLKAIKLINFALESFQKQIPHKEDQQTKSRILKEFDDEVVKIVRELTNKNWRNERYSENPMGIVVALSVEKYSSAIDLMLRNEPLAEPCKIRIQHETQQELNMPIFNNLNARFENLRSDYLQRYFEETDRVFVNKIRMHSSRVKIFLESSHKELLKVFYRFVGNEAKEMFQTQEIPLVFLQNILESFNEKLDMAIAELKDSTTAYQEIVEKYILRSQPASSKKLLKLSHSQLFENRKDKAKILAYRKKEPIIHVSINLDAGETHRLEAFTWTVNVHMTINRLHTGAITITLPQKGDVRNQNVPRSFPTE